MHYIINKVLFNSSNKLVEKQISCECLHIFLKKYEAINFINQLKHISILYEDIILTNPIKKEPINNKDVDGYHVIYDDENTHKYNIYLKKSSLNKGYLYNTVNIGIKYIGFIEIINYNPKTEIEINKTETHNIQEKYIDTISKNTLKSVISKPCIMPTIFEEKETSDNDIKKQKVNIEKPNLTNINKKQKLDKEKQYNKHLYVELNDQLIEELKKKLERLSLKKNI